MTHYHLTLSKPLKFKYVLNMKYFHKYKLKLTEIQSIIRLFNSFNILIYSVCAETDRFISTWHEISSSLDTDASRRKVDFFCETVHPFSTSISIHHHLELDKSDLSRLCSFVPITASTRWDNTRRSQGKPGFDSKMMKQVTLSLANTRRRCGRASSGRAPRPRINTNFLRK